MMTTLQQTNRNVLNGSHTHTHSQTHARTSTVAKDRQLTQNHFLLTRTLKWRFKFHIALHISSATADSFRDETEQKYKKKRGGTKTRVWRVRRGTVQVCRSSCASRYKKKCYKSTRTTLLSTRQIKGRPSPLIVYR